MPIYRYTAEDSEGRPTDGHIGAETVEEARHRLEQQGLRVLEVIQAESGSYAEPRSEKLSADEGERLVENVANLSAAGLPLSPGLRAAGDESDSPRLANAFYYLADQIDQGRSLDEVLTSTQDLLPRSITVLIQAAAQSGQLGPALSELVEHYRATSALRRNIGRGLAYPVLVAVLAAVVLGCIVTFIAPGFEQIFSDFGARLPAITLVLF